MAPLPLHRAPVGAIYLHLDPLEHQKSVHRGEGRVTINNALLDELRMKSIRLNFTFYSQLTAVLLKQLLEVSLHE